MKKKFTYESGLPQLIDLKTTKIDGKRFYQTPTGEKYPSVTTVFSFFKKQTILEWRKRIGEEEAQSITNRASVRGTKMHSLLERYLRNEDNILTENVMPDLRMAFNDALPFVNKIDNIHYVECPLYSHKLRLAGRTDCIAEYDGVLSVIDFKTSRKEKREEWITDYFLQGCAYSIMCSEMIGKPIKQTVIIMSTDHLPEPQIFIKKNIDYVKPLLSKVRAYHKIHGT